MLPFASSTLPPPVSAHGVEKKLMRAVERLLLLGSGLSSDLLFVLISFACNAPWVSTAVSRRANVIFSLHRRSPVVCFSCFRSSRLQHGRGNTKTTFIEEVGISE